MNSLTDFALNEEYKHIQKLGDKLAELDSLIDWEISVIIQPGK